MSRPALSALRALEIIDLLAGMPAQALTLSEIVRLTGTNVASCHAILNVLVQQGYLLRHPVHKTYRLAPSIVAIGEAAAGHDPLLASARRAAETIAERTGLETLLTARAGGDIIGVARVSGGPLAAPSLRVGQRVPLRPPIGGLFYAWTSLEDALAWIMPDGDATPEPARRAHEAALALLRRRGCLISLSSSTYSEFTRTLAVMPDGPAADPRLGDLLEQLDDGLYQPESIEADAYYRVKVVSVPIFDAHGHVLFTIGANFPPDPVGGRILMDHVETVMRACAAAMRENGITPPTSSR